jgi:polyisoprenoid-binding protein YceI
MNSKINTVIAFVFFTFLVINVQGQHPFALKSAKASIQGTSSLHDWESEITKLEFKGAMLTEGNALKSITSAEVKILVADIKSTKGKIMDNKTKDAFLYEKNPYISYKFTNAQIKTDEKNLTTIEATGTLTMAGTSRPIALSVKAKVLPNGDLSLSVSKKLKMTEFKMEPPTAMMGTITVGDEVTINFDLVITPAESLVKK